MKKILFPFLFALATTPTLAQARIASQHDSHAHARNEIGLGLGTAYEVGHNEWTAAYHLHYFRTITPHSRWAVGGGVEYLRGEESHTELAVGVRYEPIERMHFTLMPGVTITETPRLSLHAEATYELLHFGNFHLGPVVGYGWSKSHSHLSAGIHAAISF